MFLSRIARPFRTVPIPARERSRLIVAVALGALAGLPVQAQFIYNVSSGTTTESDTLTGSDALTKNGAGTLKLTAENTYSGGTTLNAGTLLLDHNSAAGTGTITVADSSTEILLSDGLNVSNNIVLEANAALRVIQNEDATFSGDISETGSPRALNINNGVFGGDSLTLTGDNTYSGLTTIDGGELIISSADNLGSSSGGIRLGGTQNYANLRVTGNVTLAHNVALDAQSSRFEVDSSKTLTLSGVISGDEPLSKYGFGTLVLSGSNTWNDALWIHQGTVAISAQSNLGTGSVNFQGGTLRATENFTLTRTLQTLSSGGALKLEVDSGKTLTLDTVTVLTTGLVKTGDGTLAIQKATSGWGTSAINAGTVKLVGGNHLLQTIKAVTLSGNGVLDLNGFNQDLPDIDGSSGTGIALGSGTLRITPGSGVTSAFAGTLSGSGNLQINGAGRMELSGALNHTGTTDVQAGTLELSGSDKTVIDLDVSSGAFLELDGINLNLNPVASNSPQIDGVVSGSGSITHGGSWTVNLTGANTFTGGVRVTSSGTLHLAHNQAAGTGNISLAGGPLRVVDGLTVANNVILEGNHRINIASGSATLSGVISETGGSHQLSKNGDGTLVLSGASTFTGGARIYGGTVQLTGGENRLPTSGRFLVESSSTLDLNDQNQSLAELDVVTGSFVDLGSGTLSVTPVDGVTSGIDGVVSGTGSIIKSGAGSLHFNAANTYTGGTTISGGKIKLGGGANRMPSTGRVSLSSNSILDLNDQDQTLAELDVVSGSTVDLGSGTLSLAPGSGVTSGVGGVVSGTGKIVKSGAGDVTLGAANTFGGGLEIGGSGSVQLGDATGAGSGTITLSAGSLNLGGQSITNAITLEGGTLTGAGTLNSPTITSGTIAPGNSPGLMSFNTALTLNASTLIQMELGGTTRGTQYDAINVTGILTQAGTLTVTLIDSFSPSSSDSFQLFSATSIGGSFATTNLPTLTEGLSWNTDNLASTGTITVTGSAVPEPAAFATLFGLFAIGFTAARRRR